MVPHRWMIHVLSVLSALDTSLCYRYLMVPAQLKSHAFEQAFVARGLMARGHDVYMATVKQSPWNSGMESLGIKLLFFKGNDPVYGSRAHSSEYKTMSKMMQDRHSDIGGYQFNEFITIFILEDCSAMMEDEEFLQEVKDVQIDLVLVEGFILAPCSAILPYFLDIPFVSMFSVYMSSAGLPMLPSFVPNILSNRSDKMSFVERLQNFFMTLYDAMYGIPFSGTKNISLIEKYPSPSSPKASCWNGVTSRSVLFIMTRDHILDWPMPSMPHYIFLPGITLQPAQPLPSDIEEYMASSKGGVVLVSFGSLSENPNQHLIDKLSIAFAKNPGLNFIFKTSNVDVEMPKNVKMLKWVPQNDLLAHNNLKIFITHCGNNGQYESVYHGVPMIGLPQFGDQPYNCHRMHVKGLGICLDFGSFTGEELAENINRLMRDTLIRNRVKTMSAILKEDKLPMDKAAARIEHVTKYGGEHLRSSSVDMPRYQYWMLDVVLFLFLSLSLCLSVVVACSIWLCRLAKTKMKTE